MNKLMHFNHLIIVITEFFAINMVFKKFNLVIFFIKYIFAPPTDINVHVYIYKYITNAYFFIYKVIEIN